MAKTYSEAVASTRKSDKPLALQLRDLERNVAKKQGTIERSKLRLQDRQKELEEAQAELAKEQSFGEAKQQELDKLLVDLAKARDELDKLPLAPLQGTGGQEENKTWKDIKSLFLGGCDAGVLPKKVADSFKALEQAFLAFNEGKEQAEGKHDGNNTERSAVPAAAAGGQHPTQEEEDAEQMLVDVDLDDVRLRPAAQRKCCICSLLLDFFFIKNEMEFSWSFALNH